MGLLTGDRLAGERERLTGERSRLTGDFLGLLLLLGDLLGLFFGDLFLGVGLLLLGDLLLGCLSPILGPLS